MSGCTFIKFPSTTHMFKKITLLLTLAAIALSSNAQVALRYGAEMDAGWGDASAVITPYVKFPTKFIKPYEGNRITKIRIGVKQEGKNVYIYIKQKPQDSKYIYRQKLESLQPGWNEIVLDTPYEITGAEDIAIGYKATFANSGGVGYSSEKFSDGDVVYYNSKNKWTSTGGSVSIQAIVEGDKLPMNEMMIGKISDQLAPYEARTMTFKGVVRNVGGNDIDNYTIRYTFDNEDNLLNINKTVAINASDTFAIEVPSTVVGEHQLSVLIDKVNGNDDAYAENNMASAKLSVRDIAFAPVIVCEELGGTWCGFCPRGIVGMELMKEKYPDRFIAIAVHSGDELQIDKELPYSYKPFIDASPGAPTCNVNRKLTGDPYHDIQRLFDMESARENHIAYSLTAEWNEDSTEIKLKSVFYSDIDIPNPTYHIAYTVTEDSVTGYYQANYYAGGKNGELYGWENKDEYTNDFCYNDLARAIYSNYHGDLCRSEDMTAGVEYISEATIPLPSTVVNKRFVNVVGQIIDHNSGYTLSGMLAKPQGDEGSGITDISANDVCVEISRIGDIIEVIASKGHSASLSVEVYSLLGYKIGTTPIVSGSALLNLPNRGVYIVRVVDSNDILRTIKIKY